MKNIDKAKENILKEVNRKIKIQGIKIAIISVVICILIGAATYFMLFVKQTYYGAESFSNVRIERKMETINQISDELLPYNHLIFTSNNRLMSNSNMNFYVENNADNTATLYFYFSQSYMQKVEEQKRIDKFKKEVIENGGKYNNESYESDILLSIAICKTNNGSNINEITKVYYMIYNYANVKEEQFEKAKENAILLWEK